MRQICYRSKKAARSISGIATRSVRTLRTGLLALLGAMFATNGAKVTVTSVRASPSEDGRAVEDVG